MQLRILLVDDNATMRSCLRSALEREDGFEVVGEAEDGRSALVLCRKHKPDIVFMDVVMPEMNGIEATRQITFEMPGTKVIGWSVYTDRRYVHGILEAGAAGFLTKTCGFEELVAAVNKISDSKNCPKKRGETP